jgi:hypothetical protein
LKTTTGRQQAAITPSARSYVAIAVKVLRYRNLSERIFENTELGNLVAASHTPRFASGRQEVLLCSRRLTLAELDRPICADFGAKVYSVLA